MDAGAARYGYEAALVACGKVINQDGSLGMAHTTPGAAGVSVFFSVAHTVSDHSSSFGCHAARQTKTLSLAT
jgi:hypothetical protein